MSLFHSVNIGRLALGGNVFLAPVAGYSDRSFRSICVDCGAAFTYTEMVSAEALARGNEKTETLMRRAENEVNYAVQIFGGNPESIAKAVRVVLEKSDCACIDINCGCPVPKIVKTGAGAALTKNPQKLYEVVKAAVESATSFVESETESARGKNERSVVDERNAADVRNVKTARNIPVTVKIRSGWDAHELTWKEAADAAIQAGAAAITIHPRTRAQGYEGKADWNIIKSLVEFAAGRVPIFGSGDLFSPEDARDMLLKTGCDAVMFARGAMGNPFVFAQTKALLATGAYNEVSIEERISTGFRELALLTRDIGEERACREMRKRFCAYTKGMKGGAELRNGLVHAATRNDYEQIFSVGTTTKSTLVITHV